MRRYTQGIVPWLWLMGFFVLSPACGQEHKKKDEFAYSGKVQMDGEDNTNPASLPIQNTQKNEIYTAQELWAEPAPVVPICVFGEEASQQSIAYYGMQQIRSPLLQGIGQNGLTRENAVQFALVNNPALFAYYENLEIGYAGLIEAGLRQNPVVAASTRFPDEPGKKVNRTYDTAISFLDYFLIPLRERAALAELQVIESEVLQKILELVRDVEINWLDASIAELKLAKKTQLVELKELAFGLASLQHKAGNISALKSREREIEFQLAQEGLKGIAAEAEASREKLGRSLGLFGSETCFQLNKDIEWISDPPLPDLGAMEKAAIENRPDLETIRREIDAIAQQAKLKEWWTYSNLKVGISREQESEGYSVVGPSIELEVPVFNYGQGERVKYDAMLAQAQKKLLAHAIAACSEVREFFKIANIYRLQLENFDNSVLPNFAKQIDAAFSHYNVMTLGIFDLFDLKEGEIEAMIEQLNALKNYEQANIELLYATGGAFVSARRRE